MATDSNRLGDTTATETATRLVHRNINNPNAVETDSSISSGEVTNHVEKHAEDLIQWKRHVERVKSKVLDQIQGHLSDLLDKALTESVQTFTQNEHHGNNHVNHVNNNHVTRDGTVTTTNNNENSHRTHTEKDGKVFMDRRSILDDLFEINHIRTIYHMFISVLFLFIISTLAVDYIDQGRCVCGCVGVWVRACVRTEMTSRCLLSELRFLLIRLTPRLKHRTAALLAHVNALPKRLTSRVTQKPSYSLTQSGTHQAKE
ncbi:sterol O-acyltransferase 2-like [Oncorhynchus clarkii lewisi]|uniref:sterol O-acyltransferase 2-like n=1 Tax=Oncorhynchus clarkii lewisi TaxID=490388 RepID=UPI0039B982C9